MNPFEISNHEKQKEKHAAIQFFRSLLEFRGHPPVCRATACTTSRESEQSVEWISTIMKTIRFVVKTNRQGTRGPEYVQRIDRTPIQTTSNRRLALLMGRFTAEDVVNSIRTSRCSPELISVET